jgi:FkbM family methyltransferase
MKRKAITAVVVLGFLLATAVAYPPLFETLTTTAMLAMGKSPYCPAKMAYAAFPTMDRQNDIEKDCIAHSKMLAQDDGLEQWQTPFGNFWIPAKGGNWLCAGLAEQERGIYQMPSRGVRPGDVVLDVGANMGVFIRTALADGASKVVGIDPEPDCVRGLKRTFAKEIESGRLIIYPKGAWDQDAVLTLHAGQENSGESSFVLPREGANDISGLPLTTIDKIVAELKLERVDFLKFDIEGSERHALAGAKATLARWHPRMAVCTYHIADDPVAIPKAIAEAWSGYGSVCGPCVLRRSQIVPEVYFYQ